MSAKPFDEIAADNREFVEAGRRAGKQEGIAKLLAHQYSTKTHFIFELLQNAEDAKASKAEFKVFHDRLEFTHDGSKLFTDRDVESITGIDDSNKDITAIGRHGIGFKSVFAYTHCPRIDSGDLHFELKDVFVPERVCLGPNQNGLKPHETRITLPFDDEDNPPSHPFRDLVPASIARASIDEALTKLNPRTVLFLKNLREVVWTASDSRSGSLLQLTDSFAGHSNARKIELTDGIVEERWIVFSDSIDLVVDADGEKESRSFPVEVGFLIEGERVVRASGTELVVYFPTEKKTELGFLVQGPFSTTKARDNIIADDLNNVAIVQCAAALAAKSLTSLRDAGLLDIKSYDALPLREADFPSDGFFRPVFESIKSEFHKSALLPSADNSYIRSPEAVLANGVAIRELIPDEVLQQLGDVPPFAKWLSGDITERLTPDLWAYVRKQLDVPEVDPMAFARRVDPLFLEHQSDAWILSLYQFLDKQKALWQAAPNSWTPAGPLRDKPFLRLESGTHAAPFDKAGNIQVFLPSGEAEAFKTIRSTFADDHTARSFLEALGLRPVGERELIHRILETRYIDPGNISGELYFRDITRFSSFAAKNQDAKEFFAPYRLFHCEDGVWRKPDQVYLDEPLKPTGLHAFYDVLGEKRPRHRMTTWPDFDDASAGLLCGLAERTGVPSSLLLHKGKCEDNPNSKFLVEEAVGNNTGTGTNKDYFVPRLAAALQTPSLLLSRLVWDLLQSRVNIIWWEARFSKNQQKDDRIAPSQLCCTLTQEPWIPQVSEDEIIFVKPAAATHELLPGGFPFDASWPWLKAIGFGVDRNLLDPADLLRQHGYAESDVRKFELAKELSLEDLEYFVQRKAPLQEAKPTFPVRSSNHPERRISKIREELLQPTPKVYSPRLSRTRTSKLELKAKEWLYRMYENDDQQVICQLCQEEMPFRKRDRRYYFEAVELLSTEYLLNEKLEQYIALCPECQAKYKEYVKSDDSVMGAIKATIRNWPTEGCDSEDWVIEVELGSESQIGNSLKLRFVEDHARALRTIVAE
jgi:hypothetical protein